MKRALREYEIEAERAVEGLPAQPMFESEDEFVAHLVAESAKLGVTGIDDALRGLAKALGPLGGYRTPHETDQPNRLEQIRVLNENDLNQACRKHLPPDWRSPSELYCLSLALWGLTAFDLGYSVSGPDEDDMLYMLSRLYRWLPEKAYDWLISEDGSDGESVLIRASDLQELSPEDAAIAILDVLQFQMIDHCIDD